MVLLGGEEGMGVFSGLLEDLAFGLCWKASIVGRDQHLGFC